LIHSRHWLTNNILFLQVKVVARDQGSPPQQGTAGVIIIVKRNKYRPEFATKEPYHETVAETFTPSLTVITVTATDADPEVWINAYIWTHASHITSPSQRERERERERERLSHKYPPLHTHTHIERELLNTW